MIKKARFKKQFWDLITVFSNWFDVGELKKMWYVVGVEDDSQLLIDSIHYLTGIRIMGWGLTWGRGCLLVKDKLSVRWSLTFQ